jgi:hypothetical protein
MLPMDHLCLKTNSSFSEQALESKNENIKSHSQFVDPMHHFICQGLVEFFASFSGVL